MRFARRMRTARQHKELSQRELAMHLGVSRGAVANWESDNGTFPAMERLQRIALVAGVNFEWLATGRGPMTHDGTQDEVPAAKMELVDDPVELRLLYAFRNGSRRRQARILEFAEAGSRRPVRTNQNGFASTR